MSIWLELAVCNLISGTSSGPWCNDCVVRLTIHPKGFICLEIHDLDCRISCSALVWHKFDAFLAFIDIFNLNL